MKKLIVILVAFLNVLSTQVHAQNEMKKDKVIYEVNIRQYSPSGKIDAVTRDLQRIKDLGVDIIWTMPITPIGVKNRKGTLGSPYSVKNYSGFNPEFGTKSDFKRFVERAHQLGMKVIIDWVANHTAWDNHWTQTNPNFYTKDENNNFIPPVSSWNDVIDLNYDNKELWTAMTNEMIYWVENFNIDGFRCDVASMVPTPFWNYAIKRLRALNSNLYMLGESSSRDLLENGFNAIYGDHLYESLHNLKAGHINANDYWNIIQTEQQKYPKSSSIMHFVTNHDKNTYLNALPFVFGQASLIFTVLKYVLPGQTLIYNGQEAGLNKPLEFFEKDPIDWKHSYMGTLLHQLSSLKSFGLSTTVAPSKVTRLDTSNNRDILVLRIKRNDGKSILALLNLSPWGQHFDFYDDIRIGRYFDMINPEVVFDLDYRYHLQPWGYRIFVEK